MKKTILALFFFMFLTPFSSIANTHQQKLKPLPPIPKKLYNYIVNTQIKSHPHLRYIGGWPVTVKYRNEEYISFQETNLFTPLQILYTMQLVSKEYYMPEFDQVKEIFKRMLYAYMHDSFFMDDPYGTVAFWPLQKYEDDKLMKNFTKDEYILSLLYNIGLSNDFDDSAYAAKWAHMEAIEKSFLNGFLKQVGIYVDLDGKLEQSSEAPWKEKYSGAFLTWVRPKTMPNDVDCIVNLNILATIAYAEKNNIEIPADTEKAKKAAYNMIEQIIETDNLHICAGSYDTAYQFLLAYARIFEHNVPDLKPETMELAKHHAITAAEQVLKKNPVDLTEASEMLIVLKTLFPKKNRLGNKEVCALINNLTKTIESEVTHLNNNEAYIPSSSLFHGNFMGDVFDWYCDARSSSLALKALLKE